MKRIQIIVEYITSDPGSAESVASQMARTVELSDWAAANIYADVQEVEDVGLGGPPHDDADYVEED